MASSSPKLLRRSSAAVTIVAGNDPTSPQMQKGELGGMSTSSSLSLAGSGGGSRSRLARRVDSVMKIQRAFSQRDIKKALLSNPTKEMISAPSVPLSGGASDGQEDGMNPRLIKPLTALFHDTLSRGKQLVMNERLTKVPQQRRPHTAEVPRVEIAVEGDLAPSSSSPSALQLNSFLFLHDSEEEQVAAGVSPERREGDGRFAQEQKDRALLSFVTASPYAGSDGAVYSTVLEQARERLVMQAARSSRFMWDGDFLLPPSLAAAASPARQAASTTPRLHKSPSPARPGSPVRISTSTRPAVQIRSTSPSTPSPSSSPLPSYMYPTRNERVTLRPSSAKRDADQIPPHPARDRPLSSASPLREAASPISTNRDRPLSAPTRRVVGTAVTSIPRRELAMASITFDQELDVADDHYDKTITTSSSLHKKKSTAATLLRRSALLGAHSDMSRYRYQFLMEIEVAPHLLPMRRTPDAMGPLCDPLLTEALHCAATAREIRREVVESRVVLRRESFLLIFRSNSGLCGLSATRSVLKSVNVERKSSAIVGANLFLEYDRELMLREEAVHPDAGLTLEGIPSQDPIEPSSPLYHRRPSSQHAAGSSAGGGASFDAIDVVESSSSSSHFYGSRLAHQQEDSGDDLERREISNVLQRRVEHVVPGVRLQRMAQLRPLLACVKATRPGTQYRASLASRFNIWVDFLCQPAVVRGSSVSGGPQISSRSRASTMLVRSASSSTGLALMSSVNQPPPDDDGLADSLMPTPSMARMRSRRSSIFRGKRPGDVGVKSDLAELMDCGSMAFADSIVVHNPPTPAASNQASPSFGEGLDNSTSIAPSPTLPSQSQQPAVRMRHRIAVVISISSYESSLVAPAPAAEHDADVLAEILQKEHAMNVIRMSSSPDKLSGKYSKNNAAPASSPASSQAPPFSAVADEFRSFLYPSMGNIQHILSSVLGSVNLEEALVMVIVLGRGVVANVDAVADMRSSSMVQSLVPQSAAMLQDKGGEAITPTPALKLMLLPDADPRAARSAAVLTPESIFNLVDNLGNSPTVIFDAWPVTCFPGSREEFGCGFGCMFSGLDPLADFTAVYSRGTGGLLSYYFAKSLRDQGLRLRHDKEQRLEALGRSLSQSLGLPRTDSISAGSNEHETSSPVLGSSMLLRSLPPFSGGATQEPDDVLTSIDLSLFLSKRLAKRACGVGCSRPDTNGRLVAFPGSGPTAQQRVSISSAKRRPNNLGAQLHKQHYPVFTFRPFPAASKRPQQPASPSILGEGHAPHVTSPIADRLHSAKAAERVDLVRLHVVLHVVTDSDLLEAKEKERFVREMLTSCLARLCRSQSSSTFPSSDKHGLAVASPSTVAFNQPVEDEPAALSPQRSTMPTLSLMRRHRSNVSPLPSSSSSTMIVPSRSRRLVQNSTTRQSRVPNFRLLYLRLPAELIVVEFHHVARMLRFASDLSDLCEEVSHLYALAVEAGHSQAHERTATTSALASGVVAGTAGTFAQHRARRASRIMSVVATGGGSSPASTTSILAGSGVDDALVPSLTHVGRFCISLLQKHHRFHHRHRSSSSPGSGVDSEYSSEAALRFAYNELIETSEHAVRIIRRPRRFMQECTATVCCTRRDADKISRIMRMNSIEAIAAIVSATTTSSSSHSSSTCSEVQQRAAERLQSVFKTVSWRRWFREMQELKIDEPLLRRDLEALWLDDVDRIATNFAEKIQRN